MPIRPARDSDLTSVAAIYDDEVSTGHSTFDTEPRPLRLWQERLASRAAGDQLLVAEADGKVVGYANAAAYRPKPGYRQTREVSIYLAPAAQGQGLGRGLYDDLLGRLAEDGVHVAVAAVALPNDASLALHRACGFDEIGVMREVGRKFDRWIDVGWWQRRLG